MRYLMVNVFNEDTYPCAARCSNPALIPKSSLCRRTLTPKRSPMGGVSVQIQSGVQFSCAHATTKLANTLGTHT